MRNWDLFLATCGDLTEVEKNNMVKLLNNACSNVEDGFKDIITLLNAKVYLKLKDSINIKILNEKSDNVYEYIKGKYSLEYIKKMFDIRKNIDKSIIDEITTNLMNEVKDNNISSAHCLVLPHNIYGLKQLCGMFNTNN